MFTSNIQPFRQLGTLLADPQWVNRTFGEVIERQYRENSWFTPEFCRHALSALGQMLAPEALDAYYTRYKDIALEEDPRRTVAVISAGNIPMAAFHDFFCILVSGNDYQGKLSSQDKHLLPALAQELIRIEPQFSERISFVEKVTNFDAVITAYKNNYNRYFPPVRNFYNMLYCIWFSIPYHLSICLIRQFTLPLQLFVLFLRKNKK